MKAWVDNQKGVGYVVCWLENHTNTPLRNFGQMQSVAFEFRNWLNRCTDERLPRWIIGQRMEDYHWFGEFKPKDGQCKYYMYNNTNDNDNENN